MSNVESTQSREYLTVFFRQHSLIAFCSGILSLMLSFYGVIAGVNLTFTGRGENAFFSFIYFTMISNVLASLSMAFVFPYTVEGMKRNRFTPPRWVAVIHYLATTSLTIVMILALGFMSWMYPRGAFGGSNIVTHVFCPLLILISFFQMENGHILTWKDRLLASLPFLIYAIIYYIEVVVIGKENGGWDDIYRIIDYASPVFAIPVLLLPFGVSTAIALFSNHLTEKRKKRMFMLWSEAIDPIEVRIEAYGLGRRAGQYGEKSSITIPYDILEYLAERYHLEMEDLMKPFLEGLQAEIRIHESKGTRSHQRL